MNETKNHSKSILFAFISIFIISAIAYLPKVLELGFYRDDWYLLYTGNVLGADRFTDIFMSDRPFRAILMQLAFQVFGNKILIYNLVAYVLRSMAGLGAYWIVRQLWPKQHLAALLMGILYVIFPAFTDQPNAFDYQAHQISMTAMVFSIGLTILAIKQNRVGLKVLFSFLSAALALLCYLGMEYFIGMEGLRFAIIFYCTEPLGIKHISKRAVKTLLTGLPILTTAFGFLLWRIFFFQNLRYATQIDSMFSNYLRSPALKLANTFASLVTDTINISLLSWGVPFNRLASNLRLREWLIAFVLCLAAIAVLSFISLQVIKLEKNKKETETSTRWAMDAILIGLFGVVISLIPVIFGDRRAILPSRFTWPGSLGAVLFLVGVMHRFLPQKRQRIILASLLTFLAVMTHFSNALAFAEDWQTARDMWWQLSWRAPQIQPGTVLVGKINGMEVPEDYVLWGPANLIYYPTPTQEALPISAEVLNLTSFQMITTSRADEKEVRSIPLSRDFSKTLVLSRPSVKSCLHVLDSRFPLPSVYADERIIALGSYSKIEQIDVLADPTTPPAGIFGSEPNHTWCYYYQKADLANQAQDWKEAARLGDEVLELGYRPDDWVEWIPFIRGFAYVGNYDEAEELIPVVKTSTQLRLQACDLFTQEMVNINPDLEEGQAYLVEAFCNR
jgi:hypothetical protein